MGSKITEEQWDIIEDVAKVVPAVAATALPAAQAGDPGAQDIYRICVGFQVMYREITKGAEGDEECKIIV